MDSIKEVTRILNEGMTTRHLKIGMYKGKLALKFPRYILVLTQDKCIKKKGGYCQGVLMKSSGFRKLESIKKDGMGEIPVFKNMLSDFTIQKVTGLEPYIKDNSKIKINIPPSSSLKMKWPARVQITG